MTLRHWITRRNTEFLVIAGGSPAVVESSREHAQSMSKVPEVKVYEGTFDRQHDIFVAFNGMKWMLR